MTIGIVSGGLGAVLPAWRNGQGDEGSPDV